MEGWLIVVRLHRTRIPSAVKSQTSSPWTGGRVEAVWYSTLIHVYTRHRFSVVLSRPPSWVPARHLPRKANASVGTGRVAHLAAAAASVGSCWLHARGPRPWRRVGFDGLGLSFLTLSSFPRPVGYTDPNTGEEWWYHSEEAFLFEAEFDHSSWSRRRPVYIIKESEKGNIISTVLKPCGPENPIGRLLICWPGRPLKSQLA